MGRLSVRKSLELGTPLQLSEGSNEDPKFAQLSSNVGEAYLAFPLYISLITVPYTLSITFSPFHFEWIPLNSTETSAFISVVSLIMNILRTHTSHMHNTP